MIIYAFYFILLEAYYRADPSYLIASRSIFSFKLISSETYYKAFQLHRTASKTISSSYFISEVAYCKAVQFYLHASKICSLDFKFSGKNLRTSQLSLTIYDMHYLSDLNSSETNLNAFAFCFMQVNTTAL